MEKLTKIILISMMSLLTFCKATPQAKYNIIADKPVFYEISNNRDYVYIYDENDNLYAYNVETKETKLIAEKIKTKDQYYSSFLLTKNGMFFRSKTKFYRLEKDKIFEVPDTANLTKYEPRSPSLITDSTFRIEKSGWHVTNYLENRSIVIVEKVYSCRGGGFFKLSKCKYKITIKYKGGKVVLKDPVRRTRIFPYENTIINGMLYKLIPKTSTRITDKYGNIYIMFYIDGQKKLIEIPVEQFTEK